jgi:2-methylcitrate dehydratase PrpD
VKVLEIAGKVKYRFDSQLTKGILTPGRVEVKTKSGRTLSRTQNIPNGHPENPMTDEEVLTKFGDCAHYSAKAISDERIAGLARRILELEKVTDVKEITEILA